MLELIQENNVIIGIIIGIITLFITMRQIIISNQKHRMDKEDFISSEIPAPIKIPMTNNVSEIYVRCFSDID